MYVYVVICVFVFFFNDTATTEIYTLSLHDALPIFDRQLDEVRRMGVRQMELVNKFDNALSGVAGDNGEVGVLVNSANFIDRKSTRLNSSHANISYAVFCLKKKNIISINPSRISTQK